MAGTQHTASEKALNVFGSPPSSCLSRISLVIQQRINNSNTTSGQQKTTEGSQHQGSLFFPSTKNQQGTIFNSSSKRSNKYSLETFPLWSYPKLFNYLQGDQTSEQKHNRQVLFKLGLCPLGFCGCSSFLSSIFQRCSWIQISLPLSDFVLFDLERESPGPSGPHAFICAMTV